MAESALPVSEPMEKGMVQPPLDAMPPLPMSAPVVAPPLPFAAPAATLLPID